MGAVIYIRCSRETYRMFRQWVAEMGFRDYEDAVRYLIDRAKRERWKPVIY